MPRWPRPPNLAAALRRPAHHQRLERRPRRGRGRSRRLGDFRLRRRPAGDARRDIGQHLRSPGAVAGKGEDAGLRLCARAALDRGDPTCAAVASRRPHHDRRHQLCRRPRHRARPMGGGGWHAGGHPDGLHSRIPARDFPGRRPNRVAARRRGRRLYRLCAFGDGLYRRQRSPDGRQRIDPRILALHARGRRHF